MQAIDPHLHISIWRPGRDLEKMSLAGIDAVISPNYGPIPVYTCETILDHTKHLIHLSKHVEEKFFIKMFVSVGLNMLLAPAEFQKVLDQLPHYIEENDCVVAIGEVGLDPTDPQSMVGLSSLKETKFSSTRLDLDLQEKVLKEQMKIAKKYNIPIDCHTPQEQKLEIANRIIDVANEAGLNLSKLIIDHSDETIVKTVLESGANVGITVDPLRNIDPRTAAKIVKKYGPERILVNSDAGGMHLYSDVLAVPKTGLEMKKLGMAQQDIRQVLFENAVELFDLKLSQ